MADSQVSVLLLAERIAAAIVDSGADEQTVATALATLLGSACREGKANLGAAIGIARLTAAVEVRRGDDDGKR